MSPKKKEHSNDFHTLVIRHYQNGDSLSEIAVKHCFLYLQFNIWSISINQQNVLVIYLNAGAKGKQEQQQIDLFNVSSTPDRRNSAFMVRVEIENELGISLHVETIRERAHEIRRVARKKPFMNKINRRKRLKFGKEMLEKPVDF